MNIRLMSACSFAAALSASALFPLSAAAEIARPVSQVAPTYPHVMRASNVEGEVVVSFTITPQGAVINPVVVSSTDRLLNDPTVKAVRQWKFAPSIKDGVPVSVKAVQEVAFVIPELHSEDATRLVTSNSVPASRAKTGSSVN